MGNVLFQQSCLPHGGWLGEVPRPSATPPPWEAPSQLQSLNTQEQWKQEGERRGRARPDKGPVGPTPGLFLPPGVLLLPPQAPKELSTASHWGKGG